MGITQRTRSKGAQAAVGLMPPGTHIRDYVVGRGHFRFSSGAAVGMGIFAVVFVVAAMMGYIVIPGGLLALYVFYEIRPPLAVVITEQGLAVLKRSLWNAKPSRLIALLPPAPIGVPSPSGSVTIELGPERVTLARGEFDRLAAATATAPYTGAHPSAMQPPPGYSPGIH